ncbi:MAG: cache domain-containing protein [Verrucomicrobiae bacterium]|nr:cache domain-containing protein [Verrucomicrobiae bacterium]
MNRPANNRRSGCLLRMPIGTKLTLSFLSVIVITSTVFIVVGIRLIDDRVLTEAQQKVTLDLNAAREIYLGKLARVYDAVRFLADRYLLVGQALEGGSITRMAEELKRIKEREKLDVLTVTDRNGTVLFRTSNPTVAGDSQRHDELVEAVLQRKEPVAATVRVAAADLQKESPELAERARFEFIPTPMARPRPEIEERDGMMLKAAAPILDPQRNLLGVIYGGVLLNRNFELVDKIKQTVFQDVVYKGKDIGTATIFLDDLRIATNVRNADGSRAIGTRIAEDVYRQVVGAGKPWLGRAYVVNAWYITAYEPIRSFRGQIIGILYVGLLEQKYLDIKRKTVLAFLGVTTIGAAGALVLSFFISRKVSTAIGKLVSASRELGRGNLEARVDIRSNDELQELADTFNSMAAALKKRDEQLKEFARTKIMESERLAIIGQLAAGVAHELNNPMQGIVTYSHLLLEETPNGHPSRDLAQKIVTQANRCTSIVRGLLDFARQRKPHKRPVNINTVLNDCLSLVKNQSLFHNIQIERNHAPELPEVVIDPSQMQQVFLNLIINAAEAMPNGGRLTTTTRLNTEERCVEIAVTDTGHGISPENMERIFDPFFTTKEATHGTGLGLAISFGIIKEHQGSISVESEVGKGTTFTVRLPISTETPA